jgi:hypothetical protein
MNGSVNGNLLPKEGEGCSYAHSKWKLSVLTCPVTKQELLEWHGA